MEVIGHRGASGTEPENTIRSFKKAEEFGVDMVELDVRNTKDGELVVFHDHDLLRLFGDPRRIKDLLLSEIKRISAEHHREIPTLEEVLASIKTGVNIEVKVHGIEAKLLEKLKSFPHKVLISSFFPGVLKKIRTLDGNVPLAFIVGVKRFHMLAIANYLAKKWNLQAIHIRRGLASLPVVKLLKLSGKKVRVWTVNTEKEFKKMVSLGIDGIVTDYPELIKHYVKSRSL